MRRVPQPRPDAYELYWYFAAERQAIFQRRVAGLPSPWSTDSIFLTYKFCNVYRAADRVSQYMIRSVACNPLAGSLDDRLFQIVAFRFFSKIETWETLKQILGHWPTISDLESGKFTTALEETKRLNGTLYTGAFILCANDAFGHSEKHLNHVALFKRMFVEDSLAVCLRTAKGLRDIYEVLHQYPLMGDFMSYQIAIDLNYSPQINFSENDFCQVGPGAVRGIKKAFIDLGDYTPNEIVFRMVECQDQEFKRLNLKFDGLWGRSLHAIDCQGLFCELDKYCRVAVPELQSQRQRIKTKFSPARESLSLFFPPKWGINGKVPTSNVFGSKARGTIPEEKCRQPQKQLGFVKGGIV
jgi:hypothetical protein